MSPEPRPIHHTTAIEEDPRLDERLTAYLFDLLDAGAAVVQSVKHQANLQAQSTPDTQTPQIDVAEQFERVARAMRRTVLLTRHIAQHRPDPARQRTEARRRIIRKIEDAIGCGTESERNVRDTEGLRAEFRERLDSPDLEDEIAHRPIPDIIADIRQDLGLEEAFNLNIYQRRTPRDVQRLNAWAAAPPQTDPHDPGPHGPDPGAPKPKLPLRPRDQHQERREMDQLTIRLAGA